MSRMVFWCSTSLTSLHVLLGKGGSKAESVSKHIKYLYVINYCITGYLLQKGLSGFMTLITAYDTLDIRLLLQPFLTCSQHANTAGFYQLHKLSYTAGHLTMRPPHCRVSPGSVHRYLGIGCEPLVIKVLWGCTVLRQERRVVSFAPPAEVGSGVDKLRGSAPLLSNVEVPEGMWVRASVVVSTANTVESHTT